MNNLIGRTLGQYRILEQVGKGGMATVYKAYQPSMERDVAVKVLSPHFMLEANFVERFDREARTIAALEHPRILPVYDYGKEADGLTYIAMRYVEGGTLADLLESSILYLEDAYALFFQIAEALAYAHTKGIVHRDMKPSNVLVDLNNQIFLADFGLAKIMEGDSQLTGNMVLGTPTYMAPEQGEGHPADERSDIYALGIILYEMTTGRPPFQAETPMAVMLKHMTESLPLPCKLNPALPSRVEQVILKALAKSPDDRFQTVSVLSETLKEAIKEPPDAIRLQPSRVVTGQPAGSSVTTSRSALQTKKPSWLWLVIGGVILLAVLLTTFSCFSDGREESVSLTNEVPAALA